MRGPAMIHANCSHLIRRRHVVMCQGLHSVAGNEITRLPLHYLVINIHIHPSFTLRLVTNVVSFQPTSKNDEVLNSNICFFNVCHLINFDWENRF